MKLRLKVAALNVFPVIAKAWSVLAVFRIAARQLWRAYSCDSQSPIVRARLLHAQLSLEHKTIRMRSRSCQPAKEFREVALMAEARPQANFSER
jgi:hypothetical protein